MNARTPGPWIAEPYNADGSLWTIRRADGFAEFKRRNWDKATALEVAALYNANETLTTERYDERARVLDLAQQNETMRESINLAAFAIEEGLAGNDTDAGPRYQAMRRAMTDVMAALSPTKGNAK